MATNVHHGKTNLPGEGDNALRAIGNSFASQFAGRKSRAALALAVSLWIANGGVASADTTVTVGSDETVDYVYDGIKSSTSPFDATPSLTGDKTGYHTVINGGTVNQQTYGGYSYDSNASGNSVTATNATLSYVLGGYSKNGAADYNEVTITGSTVTGYINGGSGTTSASHNTVTLTRTTVNRNVSGDGIYGGAATSGSPTTTYNIVSLTDSTIYGYVLGGIRTSAVTGNTLNLSGKNTADSVGNFETVNIKSATWGTPVMTAEDFYRITNIDASGLEFTNPEAASESTTLLSKTGTTRAQSRGWTSRR